MTPEQVLDAMSEANRSWQDAGAAAYHWTSDPELAQELLAAAIAHGAAADRLLAGHTWEYALDYLLD